MKSLNLKLLALLFALLVTASMLIACKPEGTGNGQTTDATTTETPGQEIQLYGKNGYSFKIVKPAKPFDDEESAARKLRSTFSNITEDHPKVITDADAKNDNSEYHIHIGYTDDEDARAFYSEIGYGDAGIKIVGKKIIVSAYTYESYDKIITKIGELLESKLADGQIKINSDELSMIMTVNKVLNTFPTIDGCSRLTYADCGLNQSLVIVEDASPEKFKEYIKKYEKDYTLVASVEDVGNFFNTYTKDKDLYNVSYSKGDDCIRVIINKNTKPTKYLTKTEVKTVTKPLVNMIGLAWGDAEYAKDFQLGLSMVFRLGDGTFMVVDGGFNREQDAYAVLKFIRENTPKGMKPTISAWFMTHAHPDHHNMFAKQFAVNYQHIVDIKALIFNPPSNAINNSKNDDGKKEGGEYQKIINVAKAIDGCEIIRAHVGDRYYIGDAVVDMLYTVDHQYPTVFTYYNTCSMIFSVKLGGQRVMVTGDGANVSFNKIAKMYGESLKSDFVQVAHHGYTTGVANGSATAIMEAYKHMAPSVVLYPNGEPGYKSTIGNVYNSYLVSLPSVKEVCIAGAVQNVFELPYTPKKAG